MFNVGKILDFAGIEEDGQVGIFLVRIVASGVVGIVDQFDFFDEFLFGFIEVGVG